jgi:signal transduction histidine kinase
MSPETRLEALLRREPRRGASWRGLLAALAAPLTYDPVHNGYALLGLLWGLPVPGFALALDLWLSGHGDPVRAVAEHPVQILFLLHPLLFGIAFGAMGTVLRRKERRIDRLVGELREKVQELEAARRRLEELDRLKARFMANVTHELKTPLVAIRGYTESILEGRFGPLTAKQQEGLQVAVRNVDRLQRLIEQLLDFERLDAGEFRLVLSDFDLVPLVHSALETLRPLAEERRLAVELRLPPLLRVRADRERIADVFLNLLSNAVKFAEEGRAIGVEAQVDAAEGRARLTVWDQGPGIPAAAQKFLFTRFWQAEAAPRRRQGGTGLGLAIVKGVLDAHGSTIQVVSEQGNGTRVCFDLPLPVGAPVPARESPA